MVAINPVTSLEAAVDGHRVMDVLQAAEWADVIITATGRKNVIGVEHFGRMKDGVVLGNAGHFPFEIDTPGLFDKSTEVEEFEDGIDSCTLASGKRIVLLCGGRMFNLGGKEPKGNTLECMDMGFTLQALSHEFVVKAADELVAGPQPVPI